MRLCYYQICAIFKKRDKNWRKKNDKHKIQSFIPCKYRKTEQVANNAKPSHNGTGHNFDPKRHFFMNFHFMLGCPVAGEIRSHFSLLMNLLEAGTLCLWIVSERPPTNPEFYTGPLSVESKRREKEEKYWAAQHVWKKTTRRATSLWRMRLIWWIIDCGSVWYWLVPTFRVTWFSQIMLPVQYVMQNWSLITVFNITIFC